jgi:hypothetical protein
MPFHISDNRNIKLSILVIILILFCFGSFILLGLLFFPSNGRPNIGKLPFTLDWEFSQVDRRIQAIVPDGPTVLLVTRNALEKYDNQQNLLWQIQISDYWKSINEPILDENRLYFDDTESVVAVNKNNGRIIWSSKHSDGVIADSKFLGVSNGRVFVEFYDHGLNALDTTTGKFVWNFHYSREYADVHFFEDKIVLFLTEQILIVDVKNGNVLKKIEIGLSKSSAAEGKKVYYGEVIDSGNYQLRSYDINTGEINTIYSSAEEINCIKINRDIIYINSGLKIIKLTTSGKVVWEIEYPRNFIKSMYSSDKYLFAVDKGGRLFGLESIDGRYIGEIRNYRLTNPMMYTIYYDNNNLIELLLATNHGVYKFKETK